MMLDLIPIQYRMLAVVVSFIATMVLAAGTGWVINGWRLEAAHRAALAEAEKRYTDLASHVQEQNAAVQAMGIEAAEADKRRALAEHYAASVIDDTGRRSRRVRESTAKDCSGVLSEAWGGVSR
jgi:hypothetical protein